MAAPQDPRDPNRIDVSLNVISDAAMQAVNRLTNELSSLREFITAQGTTNPADRAAALSRAAGAVQATVETGIYHGVTPGAITPGVPSNPSDAARLSREQYRAEYQAYLSAVRSGNTDAVNMSGGLSQPAENMMAHNLSDWQRWKLAGQEKKVGARNAGGIPITSRLDRFFELYPGVQRDPNEDRTYEDVSGIPRSGSAALPEVPLQGGGGGRGIPPSTPSSGMADYGDEPGWASALRHEGINPESRLGMTIPRLGEFTIQDKLNMFAQWGGRAAMRGLDNGADNLGTRTLGRASAGAAYLRDQSAAIVAVQREFQRLRAFASAEEQSAEALGFSREAPDISLFGAGMRIGLPGVSEASREALHQEFTQRRVQAAPGVSGEEAQRIRQVVAGMGYSGQTNENLQYDMFKQLQQRGIGPEMAAPLIDQGIRQGNSSLASLRDVIIQLADVARNANMSLGDVMQSTAEYAESVQEVGANYEQALRNARIFTGAGLDPRIAGQAMQSPMVQGLLTQRTGLPPQLQGIIGATGVMGAMGSAIQMGLNLGRPFANMPDRTIRSASGQEITIATGRDAQIAMAQQTTGLPRQIIERYMRNPDFLETGGTAQTMVEQMRHQVEAQRGTRTHFETERVPANELTDEQRARIGNSRGAYWPTRQRAVRGRGELTAGQRRSLESGSNSDDVIQWNELQQQMVAMDPHNKDWQARIRKLAKDHPDIESRLQHAQRIIGEQLNPKPEPDYIIDFTPAAKKWLQIKTGDQSSPRTAANAGGVPANRAYQGPAIPKDPNSTSAHNWGNRGG